MYDILLPVHITYLLWFKYGKLSTCFEFPYSIPNCKRVPVVILFRVGVGGSAVFQSLNAIPVCTLGIPTLIYDKVVRILFKVNPRWKMFKN